MQYCSFLYAGWSNFNREHLCLGLGELYLYWREIEINQRLDAKDACFIGTSVC